MQRTRRSRTDSWTLATIRGARVVFEPFTRADAACVQVWVRAGAAFEGDEERGVAHFLEHLLFQSRPERFGRKGLGEAVEAAGGSVNAWTSQDYTVVHATFPAPSIGDVLRVLLHHVLAPDLPREAIERERGVILQEIAREEENPSLTCTRTLFEERYAGHPYGRRVLGTRDTVKRLARDEIAGFHGRFYRPDNLVISVVANRPWEEVARYLDSEMSRFDAHPAPVVRPRIPRAGPGRAGVRRDVREAAEAYFCVGFPIPPLFHPAVPALDCFSAFLGEMRGSRLETWRRETGLVNEVGSFSYTPVHGGTFLVHGSAHPDRLGRAIEGVAEVLAEALATPPSERDLAAVRQDVVATAMRLAETAQGRAGTLGHETASAGRPGYLKRYLARVLALTPAEVAATARAYLGRRRAAWVLVGPVEGVAGGPGRFRAPAAVVAASPPRRVVPPGGGVLLHWRDRTHGTVAVRVQAAGGLERETAGDNGLHALLARVHLCGAGGRSGPDVMREFDALGAAVGLNAGYSVMSAWLDVPAGNVMAAAHLLAECLAGPDLDPKDLRREADLLIESIRSRVDRPQALLVRELLSRLFQGDPYGLDPLGRPDVLSRLTPDRLRDAIGVWDPSALTVAVVGDHEAEPVAAVLGAALRGRAQAPRPPVPPPCAVAGGSRGFGDRPGPHGQAEATVVTGPFRQGHVGLAWPGPDLASPDLLAARVAVSALSMMSGPLFRVLRDDLGIAYSVGATLSALRRGGYVVVTAAVRPGTEGRALAALRGEVDRLARGAAEVPDLLRRAADHLAGVEALSFQKKGAVAHWMCSYNGTPLGYDSFLDIGRRVRAVPPEAAVAAARRVLGCEPVVVILRPEGS